MQQDVHYEVDWVKVFCIRPPSFQSVNESDEEERPLTCIASSITYILSHWNNYKRRLVRLCAILACMRDLAGLYHASYCASTGGMMKRSFQFLALSVLLQAADAQQWLKVAWEWPLRGRLLAQQLTLHARGSRHPFPQRMIDHRICAPLSIN